MSIEFTCEHCGMGIKAPDDAGGRNGKCPHCKGVNYIPRPTSEEELDLVPLDEEEEQRRKTAAARDLAFQRKLLAEKPAPEDRGARKGRGRGESSSGISEHPTLTSKQVTSLVVSFIDAMSSGTLEKADKISAQLSGQRGTVSKILDDLMQDDVSGYGLPAIPKPVLHGFLKQLRSKLKL